MTRLRVSAAAICSLGLTITATAQDLEVQPAVYQRVIRAAEVAPVPTADSPAVPVRTVQPPSYEVHFHAPLEVELPPAADVVDSADSSEVTPVSFRRYRSFGTRSIGYGGYGLRAYTYYRPTYRFGFRSYGSQFYGSRVYGSYYRPWYTYSAGYHTYRPWYGYAPSYWSYRSPGFYGSYYRAGYPVYSSGISVGFPRLTYGSYYYGSSPAFYYYAW